MSSRTISGSRRLAASRDTSGAGLARATSFDETVPPDHSGRLNEWIAGSRLVGVPDTGHTFGAQHPFAGWSPALEIVARELDDFLPHVGRLGGI